ncbi:MAG: acetolactate decarboxylase [Methanomicrobiales archaeon]
MPWTLGAYEGVQAAGVIEKHGDFGIGTFEALDGELIAVDGQYFKATSDGTISRVDPLVMISFASVTFFDNDSTILVSGSRNFSTFTSGIDKGLPSKNLIYAIRADAKFPEMVVRAIPRQEKPYPPLTEAATHQVVTRLENTSGTIVGFYLPVFMKGVNMPGYHLHYISSDRKSGGHILDFTPPDTPVMVIIDQTPDFSMSAPTTGDFAEMNFSGDVSPDLIQVEH